MAVDKEKAVAIGKSGAFIINHNWPEYINRSTAYGIFATPEDGREDEYEERFYEHLMQNWAGPTVLSNDIDDIQDKEDITIKMISECFGRDWESQFLGG